MNVISSELVTAPCEGNSLLIAYSTNTGATLIQCSADNVQENKIFIYDRHNPQSKPLELDGGRFMRPGALSQAATEGVPDKFAPVPLCDAKNSEAPTAGTLVIVEKLPGNSDNKPYCYRVHYVDAGKTLVIRSDEGRKLSALSRKDTQQWTRLRDKLSSYIPESK